VGATDVLDEAGAKIRARHLHGNKSLDYIVPRGVTRRRLDALIIEAVLALVEHGADINARGNQSQEFCCVQGRRRQLYCWREW